MSLLHFFFVYFEKEKKKKRSGSSESSEAFVCGLHIVIHYTTEKMPIALALLAPDTHIAVLFPCFLFSPLNYYESCECYQYNQQNSIHLVSIASHTITVDVWTLFFFKQEHIIWDAYLFRES